jgi:hypothetical protein
MSFAIQMAGEPHAAKTESKAAGKHHFFGGQLVDGS